jgi:hypothetical protein
MPIYFRAILIDPDSSLVTVGLWGSLAEEKQKRRYEAVFVAKLNDCVRSGFCPSGRARLIQKTTLDSSKGGRND